MIKVFKTNANGKIELALEELEKLLKEAEEEGRNSIVRTTPAPSITYPALSQSATYNHNQWSTLRR